MLAAPALPDLLLRDAQLQAGAAPASFRCRYKVERGTVWPCCRSRIWLSITGERVGCSFLAAMAVAITSAGTARGSPRSLLGYLDPCEDVGKDVLALLETFYIEVLEHSERPPKHIMRALEENPRFFADLARIFHTPCEICALRAEVEALCASLRACPEVTLRLLRGRPRSDAASAAACRQRLPKALARRCISHSLPGAVRYAGWYRLCFGLPRRKKRGPMLQPEGGRPGNNALM